jgi:hypothetical protein
MRFRPALFGVLIYYVSAYITQYFARDKSATLTVDDFVVPPMRSISHRRSASRTLSSLSELSFRIWGQLPALLRRPVTVLQSRLAG